MTGPAIAWGPSAVISFLLLFALSVESVPLPIQAQIIPLTSLFAILFLPLTITRIRVTPLLKMVITFVIFVMLHSAVALFVDVAALGAGEIRVLAWARQVAALVAGISVFLVLRKSLISISDQFIIRAVIAGALPALVLALLNLLWGLTGNAVAGSIVSDIRSTLIPLGYTSPSRASGLSLEPSHFAFYLAVIVIPVCFVALVTSRRPLRWIILLGLTLAVFACTLSTTGFVVFSAFIIAGMLLGPRRRMFTIALIVLPLLVRGFLVLFPSNYAIWQVRSLLSGEWSLSITDRFYSTSGPFITSLSSYTLIGYGLGGTCTHFFEVIPAIARKDIAAVSWEGMPNLRSLIGRILVESGLVGLLLFAAIIVLSLKELRYAHRASADRASKTFLKSARLALLCLLIGITIGHGSFALPYLWFWLAFVDSRYILNCLK